MRSSEALADPAAAPSPSTAPRAPLYRALAFIGPNFTLMFFFIAALLGLVVAYGASLKWKEGPILISAGITLGLIAISVAYRTPRMLRGDGSAKRELATAVRNILRDWGPLILVMWLFESMETYTGVIRKVAIDDTLYHIDLRVFGVEPTVWIGKLHHPLVTDWMSLAYGLYFITPMFLATILSLRGRRADFQEMVTAVVIQMGIGFILFLFFPAGPPRHYPPFQHGVFQPPVLHSMSGLYELQQGAFDTADPLRVRSAFPSLHCSLALLTLIYAWRFGDAVFPKRPKLFRWIVLVLVVSLWISTVYLRHHWIPDILAGWTLGATSNALAAVIRKRWPRMERAVAPAAATG